MAAPVFKKSKVAQTINLNDEFGIDFSGKRALKEAIGQAIIDKIRTRTQEGAGMKFSSSGAGSKYELQSKPYSKEYKQSDEFKAFGKTNKVNLTLTGDMLGLIDITKIEGNKITIGWDESEENAKAYNHSVGDTVKPRPFFGVSKSELKDIKSKFAPEIKEALKIKQSEGKKAFESFALGLIDKIKGE